MLSRSIFAALLLGCLATACVNTGYFQIVNDPRDYYADRNTGVWIRTFDMFGNEVAHSRFALATRKAANEWLSDQQYIATNGRQGAKLMVIFQDLEWTGYEAQSSPQMAYRVGSSMTLLSGGATNLAQITHHVVQARVFRHPAHLPPEEISRGEYELLAGPFFEYEHWSYARAVRHYLFASLLYPGLQHSDAPLRDSAVADVSSGCWPNLGFEMLHHANRFTITEVAHEAEAAGLQVGDSVIAIDGRTPLHVRERKFSKDETSLIQVERGNQTLKIDPAPV